MMIWVFKTSVKSKSKVRSISAILDSQVYPGGSWNFDLDDCDKILRIESERLEVQLLQDSLARAGVVCEELAG